jgi:DNA-directed RNA polymerase specialized sigma24 family protein
MTSGRKLRLLDVDRLADECADQTAKFFNRANHDTGYCYELFRRAFVDRNNDAWERIFQIYRPLVASWVSRHNGLRAAGEDVDFFINSAFDRIWSAVDAEKFSQFQDLASLLRYFQLCVHSAIVDYARSNRIKTFDLEIWANRPSPNSPLIEQHVTDDLERLRLWDMIVGLMRSEKEIIVLRCSYVYDFKPSEIYAAYPSDYESLDEVYRVKRNLLNRLRRNPMLRQFLK